MTGSPSSPYALTWLKLGVVLTVVVLALAAGLVFFSNPAPQSSTLNDGPSFTYTVSNGTYTFSAEEGFANYAWNFGDGMSATGSVVSHTYESNGNYTVTLTATPVGGSQIPRSTVQLVLVNTVTTIIHNYFVSLNVSVGNSAS